MKTFVLGKQGCKAIDVATEANIIIACARENVELPDLLEEMVRESKLVEVEYSVPGMEYRTKSFLLPAGSTIHRG